LRVLPAQGHWAAPGALCVLQERPRARRGHRPAAGQHRETAAMKVAGLQLRIVWEDPQANHERLRPWLDQAQAAGARLVVLPEMYACGFSMHTERIAEPEDGPSTRFLADEAAARGLWI